MFMLCGNGPIKVDIPKYISIYLLCLYCILEISSSTLDNNTIHTRSKFENYSIELLLHHLYYL